MAENKFRLEIEAKSINESFARTTVSSFVARLDPTIEELTEIKTAVSEAVSNSIIHGYMNGDGKIIIEAEYDDKRLVTLTVSDLGKGIEDVTMARMPLFSTGKEGERSGMGFTVMENFMDTLEVESSPGLGTKVVMTKKISNEKDE